MFFLRLSGQKPDALSVLFVVLVLSAVHVLL